MTSHEILNQIARETQHLRDSRQLEDIDARLRELKARRERLCDQVEGYIEWYGEGEVIRILKDINKEKEALLEARKNVTACLCVLVDSL